MELSLSSGVKGIWLRTIKMMKNRAARIINLTTWDYWQRILKATATFPKWFPMPMLMVFTIDLELTWRL